MLRQASVSTRSAEKSISELIIATLFLGTPHRGPEITASTSVIGDYANQRLVTDLGKNS